VTKVTSRLRRQGRIRSYPLYHPKSYFTLGPIESQARGMAMRCIESLGPQALPTAYAVVAYATLGKSEHPRLLPHEVRRRWPWLAAGGSEPVYCLDGRGSSPILERLRVDLGGKPDHVARKCCREIRRHQGHAPFAALLKAGRFRLVVVSGTPEKAKAIGTALDARVWPEGLRLHVAIVPELLRLTARINHGS